MELLCPLPRVVVRTATAMKKVYWHHIAECSAGLTSQWISVTFIGALFYGQNRRQITIFNVSKIALFLSVM
jgi:hypothetical protein